MTSQAIRRYLFVFATDPWQPSGREDHAVCHIKPLRHLEEFFVQGVAASRWRIRLEMDGMNDQAAILPIYLEIRPRDEAVNRKGKT